MRHIRQLSGKAASAMSRNTSYSDTEATPLLSNDQGDEANSTSSARHSEGEVAQEDTPESHYKHREMCEVGEMVYWNADGTVNVDKFVMMKAQIHIELRSRGSFSFPPLPPSASNASMIPPYKSSLGDDLEAWLKKLSNGMSNQEWSNFLMRGRLPGQVVQSARAIWTLVREYRKPELMKLEPPVTAKSLINGYRKILVENIRLIPGQCFQDFLTESFVTFVMETFVSDDFSFDIAGSSQYEHDRRLELFAKKIGPGGHYHMWAPILSGCIDIDRLFHANPRPEEQTKWSAEECALEVERVAQRSYYERQTCVAAELTLRFLINHQDGNLSLRDRFELEQQWKSAINERESYKARFEWTRLPALDGALKWNYGRLYRLARMVGHVLRFPRRSDARTEGNSVASSTDGGSTGGIPSKSTGATARSINTTALKGKDHDS